MRGSAHGGAKCPGGGTWCSLWVVAVIFVYWCTVYCGG